MRYWVPTLGRIGDAIELFCCPTVCDGREIVDPAVDPETRSMAQVIGALLGGVARRCLTPTKRTIQTVREQWIASMQQPMTGTTLLWQGLGDEPAAESSIFDVLAATRPFAPAVGEPSMLAPAMLEAAAAPAAGIAPADRELVQQLLNRVTELERTVRPAPAGRPGRRGGG
jgi:hypothetical protein